MSPEVYWIGNVPKGRLAIMARPRAGEWLRDEVLGWCDVGISVVVSLLEEVEVLDLGLAEEAKICRDAGIEFLSFPVPDRGVPKSVAAVLQLARTLSSRVQAGASVAIHCRAGIGRSALIAACVLVLLGERSDEVFSMIGRARGVEVPDTTAQGQWLSAFRREAVHI